MCSICCCTKWNDRKLKECFSQNYEQNNWILFPFEAKGNLNFLPAVVQARVAYDGVALDDCMDLNAYYLYHAAVAFQLDPVHYCHLVQLVFLSVNHSYFDVSVFSLNWSRVFRFVCQIKSRICQFKWNSTAQTKTFQTVLYKANAYSFNC